MQIQDKSLEEKIKKISPIRGLTRKLLIFLHKEPSSLLELRKIFYLYSATAINQSIGELKHKQFIEETDGVFRVSN